MSDIKIGDLIFEPWISASEIAEIVDALADRLRELHLDNPLFIGILQGSYIFMSDLLRAYGQDCQSDWLRVSSYQGLQSTGRLKWLVQPDTSTWKQKDIILVEDIIDSGYTIHQLHKWSQDQSPKSLHVISLLRKPTALKTTIPDAIIGRDIADRFVIGYGLDYQENGRNLSDIYCLKSDHDV